MLNEFEARQLCILYSVSISLKTWSVLLERVGYNNSLLTLSSLNPLPCREPLGSTSIIMFLFISLLIAGTDFRVRIWRLSVRFWRLKTVPALKGLRSVNDLHILNFQRGKSKPGCWATKQDLRDIVMTTYNIQTDHIFFWWQIRRLQ